MKDVPAFYIPYFIYPIEQDQRSTGILFPHFGQSDTRGFNIGTGFFWVTGRSSDQTFYVDHFTEFGYGFGHELRYKRTGPSRGNFRTYGFRRDAGRRAGSTISTGTRCSCCRGSGRPTLNVQESSTLIFQEQFQDNIDLASRRTLRSSASLQRSFGPLNVQAYADSVDTFFGSDESFDRRRHVPALAVNHSSRKLGRSGFVFGFESRAENLEFGNQDVVNRYSRFDLYPRLSRPMSVSFLQFTPQVQARATRYGATNTEDGFVDESDRPAVPGGLGGHAGADLLAGLRERGRLLLRPLQARDRPRGDLDLSLEGRGVRLHPEVRLPRPGPRHQPDQLRPRAAPVRQAPRRLGKAGGLRVHQLAGGPDLLRGHRRGAERVRPQLLLRGLRPRRGARALLPAAVAAAPAPDPAASRPTSTSSTT